MKKLFFFLISNLLIFSATSVAQGPPPPPVCPYTTTWDGTSWSNGVPNTPAYLSYIVNFNGNFSSTESLFACRVVIGTSYAVTINNGHTLTVDNDVDATQGVLTFQNNASLVQINNDAVNSGSINYIRLTTPVVNTDYTYWSSPVQGQVLYLASASGQNVPWYGYYMWDASATPSTGDQPIYYSGAWQNVDKWTHVMQPGRGYIISGPTSFGSTAGQYATMTFSGVPNNGIINMPVIGHSYSVNNTSTAPCTKEKIIPNLIGNPYPSALDADSFLDANQSLVNGAIYLWAHNTIPDPSIQTPENSTVYTRNDYTVYNRLGGVGTGRLNATLPNSITNSNRPNGKIAAGQGFTIQALATGNVVFSNDMRDGATGANNQFFRTSSAASMVAPLNRDRIWLAIKNESYTGAVNQTPYKETLVGYIDGATNGYEKRFDTESYSTNPTIDLYSITSTSAACNRLVIQGRQRNATFNDSDVIPLGYTVTEAGTYTITSVAADGIFGGSTPTQRYFLQDLQEHIIYDLSVAPYTFTMAAPVTNDTSRFRLIFKAYTTQLASTLCNTTRSNLASNLSFDQPFGGTFELHVQVIRNHNTLGSMTANFTLNSIYSFSLANIYNLDPSVGTNFLVSDATYTVRAFFVYNGVTYPWGRTCTINTVPITDGASPTPNLICGLTFPVMPTNNQQIMGTNFFNQLNTRWEVRRVTDDQVVAFTQTGSTQNFFRFRTTLPTGVTPFNAGFIQPNTQYCVRMAPVYPSGIIGNFGNECCFTTSPTYTGKLQSESNIDFSVSSYPNPFKNNFTLDIQSPSDEEVGIQVFDLLGKQIETKYLKTFSLDEKISLGDNYSIGVYTIIVTQGEDKQIIKMIKQ